MDHKHLKDIEVSAQIIKISYFRGNSDKEQIEQLPTLSQLKDYQYWEQTKGWMKVFSDGLAMWRGWRMVVAQWEDCGKDRLIP